MTEQPKLPPYKLRELVADILSISERFAFSPSDPLYPLIRSLLTLALALDVHFKVLTRETQRVEAMLGVDLPRLILKLGLCLVGTVSVALLLGGTGGYFLGDRRTFGSSLTAEEQVRQALDTDAHSARIWKRYAALNDLRNIDAACAEKPAYDEHGSRVCHLRMIIEPSRRHGAN